MTVTATWSPNADPEEIDCPVCEVFNGALHFAGAPPHEHEGEDDVDADPPIGGGAHGGVHHISEYSPCKVPLRRVEWCNVSILVHEGAIPSLRRVEAGWRRLGGADFYVIRQSVTAFYVCRKTVSGRSWSIHSICAGDVNWDRNPYGSQLVTDMPPSFRQLFLDEGWGWGGNWRSKKDAMHFSKAPHEGGDGLLYVGGTEQEEALVVTKDDEEKIREIVRDELKTAEKLTIQVVKDGQKVKLGIDHFIKALAVKEGVVGPNDEWLGG